MWCGTTPEDPSVIASPRRVDWQIMALFYALYSKRRCAPLRTAQERSIFFMSLSATTEVNSNLLKRQEGRKSPPPLPWFFFVKHKQTSRVADAQTQQVLPLSTTETTDCNDARFYVRNLLSKVNLCLNICRTTLNPRRLDEGCEFEQKPAAFSAFASQSI